MNRFVNYVCGLQKLDLFEGDLPETTTDLIVSGAGVLMFGANSLSRLRDARRIYITGAEIVFLRAYAASNLDVLYLHLDVKNCDVLRLEEKAFVNIKGKCLQVVNTIASANFIAFSDRISSANIKNSSHCIRELTHI